MKNFTLFFILVVITVADLSINPASAEGTREMMPPNAVNGFLTINKMRNDFGFFDASPEYHINISIADPSEIFRYGFGAVIGSGSFIYSGDMQYRIKDPSGNIVYGPIPVPESGQQGYIDSYLKAVAGPVAGGYSYLEFHPGKKGDFCMEFYYPPGFEGYVDDNQHGFEYFDITVMDAAGNPKPGRVWSEAWQFWCGEVEWPPSDHRFWGTLMILSDDSIVTQVNANGMIGGTFSVSSNATGCSNTGNIFIDRQSTSNSYSYPKYKIFLNDPDSILFPTAKVTSGVILPITVATDCNTGGADIGIKVVKDGTVEVLIELNTAPGANPEDVKLEARVLANPGGNGYNIIHWNGKDNHGIPVANGTVLLATVTCLNGLTNLPLYDIEYSDNGFIVSQVRPPGPQVVIFWDDTQLEGGTANTVTGCISGSGCHTWDDSLGNLNTINSWWYVKRTDIPSVPFTLKRLPDRPGTISGVSLLCDYTGTLEYTIPGIRNSESYLWSYSGSGVIISGSDSIITLSYTPASTPGVLSVRGHNALCGDGPSSDLTIAIDSLPTVTLSMIPEICHYFPGISLTGGLPAGGDYSVDGVPAQTFEPQNESLGQHWITYHYSVTAGCSNSDSAAIVVNDCEDLPVFFPDAFSPNGDGLNDLFRTTGTEFLSFNLSVFDRSGQLIFYTENPSEGWNGKYRGTICPVGVYVWISTYEIPDQNHTKKTVKGLVTLLR